jgi:hypothetical protein
MLVVLVLCCLVPFPVLNCLVTSSPGVMIYVEGRVSEVTKPVEILEA